WQGDGLPGSDADADLWPERLQWQGNRLPGSDADADLWPERLQWQGNRLPSIGRNRSIQWSRSHESGSAIVCFVEVFA
ncbi:MAG: hypothetical protein ACLGXA_13005, partial [Acidobacteriota bacterium]